MTIKSANDCSGDACCFSVSCLGSNSKCTSAKDSLDSEPCWSLVFSLLEADPPLPDCPDVCLIEPMDREVSAELTRAKFESAIINRACG